MKTPVQITVVDSTSSHLTLSEPIATALGLVDGSELKWIVLQPKASEHVWYEPDLTLIASTMPVRAWGRLMRGSFNLKPGSGSAAALINHMEQLSLYVRHFQIEESVIATHQLRSSRPLRYVASHPTAPTALLTFEIGGTPDSLGDGLAKTLLDAVRSVDDRVEARQKLDGVLSERLRELAQQPLVNWLSPLQLLNALANEYDSSQSPNRALGASRLSALLQEIRSTILHRTPNGLESTIDPFKIDLWSWARERPSILSGVRSLPIALLMTADSDERTLYIRCFRLFSPHPSSPPSTDHDDLSRVLVSFDLLMPAGGLESMWMRWLLDVIKEDEGGALLAAHTSARQEGRWVCAHVTATFATWQRATRAMHRLQGDHSYCRHDDKDWHILQSRLGIREDGTQSELSRTRILRDVLPGSDNQNKLDHAIQYPAQDYSLLSSVSVHGGARPGGVHNCTNPFSFTRPLNLTEYDTIYSDTAKNPKSGTEPEQEAETKSRLAIAENIVDVLTGSGGENVAIIGAQRTGKTSLLRMIEEIVGRRSSTEMQGGKPWLMVIVDAGTTPPHELFLRIIEQLADDKNSGVLEKLHANRVVSIVKSEAISTATAISKDLLTHLLRTIFPRLEAGLGDKPSSAQPSDHVDSREIFEGGLEHEIQRIEHHITKLDPKSDDARARFTRSSLKALNRLISELSVRLIIAMDEVTDGSAWKGDWSFSVWRQQLEDQREYAPRWLFSSLQPLAEATNYQPLGNVAREINLPPLSRSEVNRLFERFHYQAPAAGYAEEPPAMLPADVRFEIVKLTGCHPYLMQVVLYHLWERVWYEAAPIATKEILRRVIAERVLPELSDFFLYATRQLSSGKQPSDVLQRLRTDRAEEVLLSTDQKLLERAGLLDARTRKPIQLLQLWVDENMP